MDFYFVHKTVLSGGAEAPRIIPWIRGCVKLLFATSTNLTDNIVLRNWHLSIINLSHTRFWWPPDLSSPDITIGSRTLVLGPIAVWDQ